MKTCNKCKNILSIESFRIVKKRGKAVPCSHCKKCETEYRKKIYWKDPETAKKRNKEYQQKNKQRLKEYKREWVIKNKDKVLESIKKFKESGRYYLCAKNHYDKNREKRIKNSLKYYYANIDKLREINKSPQKKLQNKNRLKISIEELKDCYVKKNIIKKFPLTFSELKNYKSLIESQREILKLKRKIKTYDKQ